MLNLKVVSAWSPFTLESLKLNISKLSERRFSAHKSCIAFGKCLLDLLCEIPVVLVTRQTILWTVIEHVMSSASWSEGIVCCYPVVHASPSPGARGSFISASLEPTALETLRVMYGWSRLGIRFVCAEISRRVWERDAQNQTQTHTGSPGTDPQPESHDVQIPHSFPQRTLHCGFAEHT